MVAEMAKKKTKKSGSFQYLIAVLVLGIALMLFGHFFQSDSGGKDKTLQVSGEPDSSGIKTVSGLSSPSTMIEYEHYYEKQLKEALDEAYGISDAVVKINVSTTQKKIVAKDRNTDEETTDEEDKQGGTREIQKNNQDEKTVMTNNGKGEQPFVIGKEQPEINGVVVVAEGADNPQIEKWIMDAAHSLFGVPNYRITVIPKKRKGNE